jgi:hypothetical protein
MALDEHPKIAVERLLWGATPQSPAQRPRRFYAKITLDRLTPQVSNIAQSILDPFRTSGIQLAVMHNTVFGDYPAQQTARVNQKLSRLISLSAAQQFLAQRI